MRRTVLFQLEKNVKNYQKPGNIRTWEPMPILGETGWQGFTLLSPALIYTLQNNQQKPEIILHFADGAPQVTKKESMDKKKLLHHYKMLIYELLVCH